MKTSNPFPNQVLIIAAEANDVVVSKLIQGATRSLVKLGLASENIIIKRVAGALELPLLLKKAALTGDYEMFVVLGAVIKGKSDHYYHVSRMANNAIMSIAVEHGLALGNGLLTVHSLEQAFERADGPVGNIGTDAAMAAFSLFKSFNQLKANK